MGLEPTPGPWQGPVLPLYYDRPETGKHYHVISAATRSYRASKNNTYRDTVGAPPPKRNCAAREIPSSF